MAILITFIMTILLSLSTQIGVQATEYDVGDTEGWETGTNFLRWSRNHNFTVGDVLVFNYVPVQHNVYQVTEETYRSCNWSSGVLKMYVSGRDRVTLAEATSYWFICGVEGHCQGGMRMGVSVASSGGLAPAPAPEERGSWGGGGRAVVRWWVLISCLVLMMVWDM
ncbi:basic blue protein-like [Zingiber officinale]|uniref:basic blue protein-like n=1 Tax=Zingiber officinale TaxID=94328 RepID=UPI001C4B3FB0|nr:basic blue protein-like [Zingiber officinale]